MTILSKFFLIQLLCYFVAVALHQDKTIGLQVILLLTMNVMT